MFIKDISECKDIIAGDKTILKEVLKPERDGLDIRYSLCHAVVKPGEKSLRHKLSKTEVYYILKGKGVMHIDEESKEVKEGSVVYIPPNAVQYIENNGEDDLVFICIVDPAWKEEDEEILE